MALSTTAQHGHHHRSLSAMDRKPFYGTITLEQQQEARERLEQQQQQQQQQQRDGSTATRKKYVLNLFNYHFFLPQRRG